MLSRWFRFRRSRRALILVLTWFLSAQSAHAEYQERDLVNVPIERLINNLETRAQKNPKYAKGWFNLARAYAMAYAWKSDTARVQRGREQEGVWFGEEPRHVPFQAKPTDYADKTKTAKEYLDRAINRYEEVLRIQPNSLPAALGHAWCVEQAGDKVKAVREYRKVIDDAWKTEKDLKEVGLGWHSITAEAIGYLWPHLDKDKDKEEIRILSDRLKQLGQVQRPITPVVVPLSDGLTTHDLEDRSAHAAFDADGSGLKKHWTWITRDAGWLVYDPHGTGQITSALQLFGGVSFWMFWESGYEALSALDDDGDGILVGEELQGLAIWHDQNGNAISEPGEVKRLAEWGIVSVSCQYKRDTKHPDRIVYSPCGVSFQNGLSRPTYDIILRQR